MTFLYDVRKDSLMKYRMLFIIKGEIPRIPDIWGVLVIFSTLSYPTLAGATKSYSQNTCRVIFL